jgi:hypothetical protein
MCWKLNPLMHQCGKVGLMEDENHEGYTLISGLLLFSQAWDISCKSVTTNAQLP